METVVHRIPVYYESYGTGLPLVMLHGLSPDHRLLTGCMEPLFTHRAGWRRIYLDLPGMGRTPGAQHIQGSDDMLDVVVDFIEAVMSEWLDRVEESRTSSPLT